MRLFVKSFIHTYSFYDEKETLIGKVKKEYNTVQNWRFWIPRRRTPALCERTVRRCL